MFFETSFLGRARDHKSYEKDFPRRKTDHKGAIPPSKPHRLEAMGYVICTKQPSISRKLVYEYMDYMGY